MEWFWGLCGAFAYAAPRLLAVLREAVQAPGPFRWADAVAEFFVAMACGPIFAVGFTPWIGHRWGWLVEPNDVALAISIGLLANPAAPSLSKAIIRGLAKRIDQGTTS